MQRWTASGVMGMRCRGGSTGTRPCIRPRCRAASRSHPPVVDEAVALPQFANQRSPAGFTAVHSPTHTVRARALRCRGTERPNRRVGPRWSPAGVPVGWVPRPLRSSWAGLSPSGFPSGRRRRPMAAPIAPRDLAATARAPVSEAIAADRAPETGKETVVQEQASAPRGARRP